MDSISSAMKSSISAPRCGRPVTTLSHRHQVKDVACRGVADDKKGISKAQGDKIAQQEVISNRTKMLGEVDNESKADSTAHLARMKAEADKNGEGPSQPAAQKVQTVIDKVKETADQLNPLK